MLFKCGQQKLILGSMRCFSKKIVVYLKSGSPARVPEVLGYNNRGVQQQKKNNKQTTTAVLVERSPRAQHSPPTHQHDAEKETQKQVFWEKEDAGLKSSSIVVV